MLQVAGIGVHAEEAPKLLGAATCGSSSCHAAASPWMNSAVGQNEYLLWRDRDPHAQAWVTLNSEASAKMANLLGISDPLQAQECLGCHTTKIGPGGAEAAFDHRDGVSCETCHGAASSWLGVHASGLYFYGKNLKNGLYPTADPEMRAKLCVTCHVGTAENFVSHQMMAAGHPPLDFQLGFHTRFREQADGTYVTYAHFQVDDDYLQRKPKPFGLKALLIGELVEWRQSLSIMKDHYRDTGGVFPELAFFDCYSCHFEVSNVTNSGRGGPMVSGAPVRSRYTLPVVSEKNFFLLDLAAEGIVDVDLHTELRSAVGTLRRAINQSPTEVIRAADRVIFTLDEILVDVRRDDITQRQQQQMLMRLDEAIASGKLVDFLSAKQALFATASILDGMWYSGSISEADYRTARGILERGLQTGKGDVRNSDDLQTAISEAVSIITLDDKAEQAWGAQWQKYSAASQ